MEGKGDGEGGGKKSAMALALERMRAKKRNNNGSPMTNGSTPSPRPSEDLASSGPIGQEGPIITAAFSTSNIMSNAPTHVPSIPPPAPPVQFQGALLTTQNVTMNFVFACNIVFKIPVTENRVLADKEYVAYAFNCGIYFFPGNDVVAEHRKTLYNGTEFKARFIHDDAKRKSFNKVEVTFCGKPLLLFKPESATMVLRLILADKAFFVQDSALSRVDGFYKAQFPNSSFIYYAKLLLDQELEQYKRQMLATDCNLLLQRIEQTTAEMSDISEIVPQPTLPEPTRPPPPASLSRTVTVLDSNAPESILPEGAPHVGKSLLITDKPKNCPSSSQEVVDDRIEASYESAMNNIEIKEEPLEADRVGIKMNVDDKDARREDYGFSVYDRKRSRVINKEEKNLWFLCKDCHPFKILSEKDESMENHCSEYPDHFQLFPDWYFSKFDLKIEDVKLNPAFQQFL
eukprot:10267.XXX_531015_532388_1 [CDS] Oithona nana genome sequencing.